MPAKKPAAARKVSPKPKTVEARVVQPPPAPPAEENVQKAAFTRVWTLPIAMLMLMVAAAGLWLAVRESSSAPQAATPAATHDSIAPVPPAAESRKAPPVTKAAASNAEPAAATDASHTAAPKPVSITGCLQHTDSGFVLKNTEGTDAPKARSWKSGFLKRSSSPIDLVEAGSSAHLGSHVGQKVSVTGPLVDREMHVQGLHRVAAICQ